jgi:RNA polymerase sigma-70 factor, ECF subfamily
MSPHTPRLASEASSPDALHDVVAALFREHYAGLVDFATRYVKALEVAEEVVQEVFLRVWTQREAGDPAEITRAYLYGATRNQAITLLRHDHVVHRHAATRSAEPHAPATPDAELEADELTRAVRAAIDHLPERSRLVFVLSRDRGLSYAEIADVLGISAKAVEANMARALKSLRKIIK